LLLPLKSWSLTITLSPVVRLSIVAADGRRTGSIVDSDKRIDLALLRVSGIKGETARLRSPRNVRLGEPVMVFGFPLAGALSSGGNFTSGLVSALQGLKDASGELQITAPVQPGNSGGPLLDANGLVIGVVQAKLDAIRMARATGDIPQNVNFVISLEVLANFLTKNKVGFREGTFSTALDTAQVAQVAQRFTYRIECNRSQQARSVSPPNIRQVRPSPNIKQDRPPPNVARDPDLARSRSDVIQKIKETRAQAEKLLALHEAQRLQALEEYNRRRDLYYQGLMTRNEVLQAEHALAEAIIRVNENKRWMAETDLAIKEYMKETNY
jgi:hypothetical protein